MKMQEKKISRKEWTEIGQYNPAAKWLRPLCNYKLIKEPEGRFKREVRVGWFVYLLIFIPVHILQAFICMWDGGLKEFEINERYLGGDWLAPDSESFKRAEKIWNSKINNR
jgi:hypothetical protein